MKYLFLLYGRTGRSRSRGPASSREMRDAWNAATEAMAEAGVLIDCAPLQPASASTTVQVRDGQTLLTDGPAAEIKEQFGGYTLVECADLDEALKWAATLPAAPIARWRSAPSCRWRLPAERAQFDEVFRAHWWAAVAAVTAQVGDLELAEDAVQDACAAALAQWPADGVPANPRGWLIGVGPAQGARPAAARAPPGGQGGRSRARGRRGRRRRAAGRPAPTTSSA